MLYEHLLLVNILYDFDLTFFHENNFRIVPPTLLAWMFLAKRIIEKHSIIIFKNISKFKLMLFI